MIYLDHNATTPLAPQVAEKMRSLLDRAWANPSSPHAAGREARREVETARGRVAALLACHPAEVVFTGGGTESNNLALRGLLAAVGEAGARLVVSAVEHPAVAEVAAHLERRRGVEVRRLAVDRTGRVDPRQVERELESAPAGAARVVSVMHANNEVGTLQPIAEIAAACREHGAFLHSDGAQAVGKVPARVGELGVDLYSLAGHKMYGPKGVGALYVRRGTPLEPLLRGAGHEAGRRPGTENVLAIAGLGVAAELAGERLEEDARRMRELRDRLHRELADRVEGLALNGHPDERLPNTLSVAFPGVVAAELLAAAPGVAASAGAACHGGGVEVSGVLAAMGVPEEVARGTVRLSLGRGSGLRQIVQASRRLAAAHHRLRESAVAG